MYVRFRILLLISLIGISRIAAYPQVDSIAYSKDFTFSDGLYLTIQDLKHNTPTLTPLNFNRYNPEIDFSDDQFLSYLNEKNKLNFPDSLGGTQRIYKQDIFAICKNGVILVGLKKVMVFGKVCFATTRNSSASISPETGVNGSFPTAHSPAKDLQFLVSYDSGKSYPYNLDNFEYLLRKKDKELFDEFSKLSRKEKKNNMFIYLNRLNERNPVYIKLASK